MPSRWILSLKSLKSVKSPEILQPHFLHLNKLLDQVVRQESAENKLTTHDQVVPLGNEPRKIKKILWFQVLLLILQFLYIQDKDTSAAWRFQLRLFWQFLLSAETQSWSWQLRKGWHLRCIRQSRGWRSGSPWWSRSLLVAPVSCAGKWPCPCPTLEWNRHQSR